MGKLSRSQYDLRPVAKPRTATSRTCVRLSRWLQATGGGDWYDHLYRQGNDLLDLGQVQRQQRVAVTG